MNNIINTKILLSGATIVAAAALIIGATYAFFSDTETSKDNVFAAGEIDLKIGNTSYALDYNVVPPMANPTGALVENAGTSWEISDLDDKVFFNFSDLKPGDYGEDTISIQAGSNDAWICAAARITENADVTLTEPESDLTDDLTTGELAQGINFAFWADDGDNVYENDENIFLQGPLSGLGSAGKIAITDSSDSIWSSVVEPLAGNTTKHIGKIWCYGNLASTPLTQDNLTTRTPTAGGTGFACDGSLIDNIGQTDRVKGDLEFYAVQARNNAQFSCATGYTPSWDQVVPTP